MIFVYVDSTNSGIPFYVGKGILARVKKLKRNRKHTNVSKKHGLNRIVLVETEDESVAIEFEKWLIEGLHTFAGDPIADQLASNFTMGGEGMLGLIPSLETRTKMSAARKGHSVSAETRAKIGAAHKGRRSTFFGKSQSLEARQKIGAAHRGKIVSAETREKQRAAKMGKRLSLEARSKLSVANKGKVISLATREKLRMANKGKTCSVETRAKMSIAQKIRFARERMV